MKGIFIATTVLFATAAFTACPPKPGPGPNPPPTVVDATVDGAPVVDGASDAANDTTSGDGGYIDAGPSVPDCALACAALAAANCPHGTLTLCAAIFTRILADGKVPNPEDGGSLTCKDIAKVRTTIDAIALGFTCP